MRPSPYRHPIAILRKEIGLLQKELASLVGRSPRTIQGIELLKAPLTMGLAEEISRQTGVSVAWLMKGNIDIPPYDTSGAPYSKATYELAQANLEFGTAERLQVVTLARRFANLLKTVADSPDAELRLWQISRALQVLEGEGGRATDYDMMGSYDSYDPSM